MKLSIFNYILIRLYHRWRGVLRNQKHHFLNTLYAQAKHRWIPKPKGPVIVPTLYGFNVIVCPDSDEIISRSIYYNGTYEAGTIHVLSKCLSKGDTFLDIGSNLGLMALFASKCVGTGGKVFAFEPEPEIFKTLKSNIELNHFLNIEPNPVALGSSKGTTRIYNSTTNLGAASLIPSETLTGHESTINIERLDDLIPKKRIGAIRMMKIDVEGWELEVLKGSTDVLRRTDAPILCIECSKLRPMYRGTTEDIYTFVSQINQYKIYRLARGKERISKLVKIENVSDLPKHDNLFCFLPCHKKMIDKHLFSDS